MGYGYEWRLLKIHLVERFGHGATQLAAKANESKISATLHASSRRTRNCGPS